MQECPARLDDGEMRSGPASMGQLHWNVHGVVGDKRRYLSVFYDVERMGCFERYHIELEEWVNEQDEEDR